MYSYDNELDNYFNNIYESIRKSSEENFGKFLSFFPDVDKWVLSSDYCFDDKNKKNNTICFTLYPVVDFEAWKKKISGMQPSDLKNTRSISDEFCDFMHSGKTFSFIFMSERKEDSFLDKYKDKEILNKIIKQYLKSISDYNQNYYENNNELLNSHIKSFRELENSMKSKSFNSKLLFRIILICFIATSIKQILINNTETINGFVWISDRGEIVDFNNGVYKEFYWLYSDNSILKEKGTIKKKYVNAIPENNPKFFYDEYVRIPDILCGIISDYDISINETSGEKQDKGIRKIFIRNPYIFIYNFYINGMKLGFIDIDDSLDTLL